jgi:hypothetical protein
MKFHLSLAMKTIFMLKHNYYTTPTYLLTNILMWPTSYTSTTLVALIPLTSTCAIETVGCCSNLCSNRTVAKILLGRAVGTATDPCTEVLSQTLIIPPLCHLLPDRGDTWPVIVARSWRPLHHTSLFFFTIQIRLLYGLLLMFFTISLRYCFQ